MTMRGAFGSGTWGSSACQAHAGVEGPRATTWQAALKKTIHVCRELLEGDETVLIGVHVVEKSLHDLRRFPGLCPTVLREQARQVIRSDPTVMARQAHESRFQVFAVLVGRQVVGVEHEADELVELDATGIVRVCEREQVLRARVDVGPALGAPDGRAARHAREPRVGGGDVLDHQVELALVHGSVGVEVILVPYGLVMSNALTLQEVSDQVQKRDVQNMAPRALRKRRRAVLVERHRCRQGVKLQPGHLEGFLGSKPFARVNVQQAFQ
eukprot:CAMPEP_0170358046 /NCGR_PEP_ID=MMETSP0117_2-20130122/2026_1 /TAXON_ID=400756 /ORGANISM="Durinskia baltica, Strain CSIRO CS-38" /LENGTH=268 /DNA_ID=CAMNT_0010612243 /DNA_START=200 /DNA_END=1008 /DNA_ORIENTATION=+